jgi:NAD(P)-dependent dehydrogenase (short-subunit alcohol dehydrogenase family)
MTSPKVVLITGGNNGIGYETVKALLQSKRPYHILVGSRSVEKGKRAIETLHKECADATNTLELVQVDLTSDESIEKAFEQVKTSPGSIDVLINNAGSFVPLSSMLFTTIVPKLTSIISPLPQAQRSTSNSLPAKSPYAPASPNPTTSTSPAPTSSPGHSCPCFSNPPTRVSSSLPASPT